MGTEAEMLALDEAPARDDPEVGRQMRPQERPPLSSRARLGEAFLGIGAGVDAKTAFRRTKGWWRRAGGPWTQKLSWPPGSEDI